MRSEFPSSIPLSIAAYAGGIAILALVWYQVKKRRLEKWVKVQGIVESYEKREVEDGVVYDPIVAFTALDGGLRRVRHKEWWGRKRQIEGTPIAVIYDPAKPHRTFIDTWLSCYPQVIALFILSAFSFFAALGLTVFFEVTG